MTVESSMASSAGYSEKQTPRARSIPKLLEIALAFAIVFFPLVLVGTLLCLFVTIPKWTIHNPPESNAKLPVPPLNESVFTTKIFMNRVTSTTSWASNIGQFAASPFLLLFSFLVALDLANRHQDSDEEATRLLKNDQNVLFSWIVHRVWPARNTRSAYGTRIAGIGACIALVFTYVFVLKIASFSC
jgi:hypothetical protein